MTASKNIPLQFDFIISGAGCAGLSLAIHMIRSGAFADKKILLVDRDSKKANDRTWCFWNSGAGMFEDVVYKSWEHIWFYGEDFQDEINILPYSYKMIRGIDFYEYCIGIIRQQKNFTVWQSEVSHVFSDSRATGIIINGQAVLSDWVFNSVLFNKPKIKSAETWLLQHFKGWIIETIEPHFDASTATLMDFRISQEHGTAFCYVLPVSSTRALIEYTLFTPSLLQEEQYNEGLRWYIENVLNIKEYQISDEEFGVIPMTDHRFSPGMNHLVNLGTAGGQTKGSSGYTFSFIQKHSAFIVDRLMKGKNPVRASLLNRHRFYDSVLLRILHKNSLPGKLVFTQLFQKNPAPRVLKFLDNETSIGEELSLISTLPTLPFLKAALRMN